MKSVKECIEWMESVVKYRNSAPEGMCAVTKGNDVWPTLRGVDPKAITELANTFPVLETYNPFTGTRTAQLSGSEDGPYYAVTLMWASGHEKLPTKAFRLFYRKQSPAL